MTVSVLATRGSFADILDRLRGCFELEHSPDEIWSRAELTRRLQVVLTPHIGSASLQTRRAMAGPAVRKLIAALGASPEPGRPPTPVNPQALR
jgi:lactate dehydrogenase-like 2-hydroxyacid dehydrogenase